MRVRPVYVVDDHMYDLTKNLECIRPDKAPSLMYHIEVYYPLLKGQCAMEYTFPNAIV